MDPLLSLCADIKNCKKCDLQYSRRNPVCGFGNSYPKMMIIGEAPGSREDDVGKPFVGRSGKILSLAIEKAGLKFRDVYLTSSVRCRPKVGRTPKIAEIRTCSDYLKVELDTIRPKIVVPMGNSALHAMSMILMRKFGRVSEANNRIFSCDKYYVIPQYHPSTILRNPKKMEIFKDNFVRIADFIEDLEDKKFEYMVKKYTVQRI